MLPKLVDCIKLVFKNEGKPDTFLPLVLLINPDKSQVLSNQKRIPHMIWETDIQLFDKLFFTEEEWNGTLKSNTFKLRAKNWYSLGDSFYPEDKLIEKFRRARNHVIIDSNDRVIAKSGPYKAFIMDEQKNLHDAFDEVSEPDEISKLSFFFGKEGVPDYILNMASKPYYILRETSEDWYITYYPQATKPLGITRLKEGAFQMAYEEQALDFAVKCELLNESGYEVLKTDGIPELDVMPELERIFKGPYIK